MIEKIIWPINCYYSYYVNSQMFFKNVKDKKIDNWNLKKATVNYIFAIMQVKKNNMSDVMRAFDSVEKNK